MMFWIATTALTLVVLATLLAPLMRAPARSLGDSSHDVEVYRDQLQELDRERDRGAIGDAEAEVARAEIGRRLIAAADAAAREQQAAASGSTGVRRMTGVALVLAIGAALPLYLSLGSPGMPAMPLQARVDASAADPELAGLVARAERHLASNPDDGRGWDVLAPVYLRLGRPMEAVTAYRNAIRLLGETSDRFAGLGEAVFVLQNGIVSKESADAFDKALALDGANPKAQFFRGLALAQSGDRDGARSVWTAMAARKDTEWAGAATTALQDLDSPAMAGPAGTPPVATGAAPQIDDETMAAAGDMSAEDQQQMIAGMIDRLDKRLRESPADSEGWKRLIRAYTVIGDRDKAGDALDRALAAFGQDAAARADIVAFAQGLGLQPDESRTQ